MEGLEKEEVKNVGGNEPNMSKAEDTLKKSEEQEKLKKVRVPQNTTSQIIIKSAKICMKNWKYFLFDRAKSITEDLLEIAIPSQKGIIIDCIIDKSKHPLLFGNFIKIVKIIIIKLIFQLFFQLGNIFIFNESFYAYKDLIFEDIVQKDVEFFDSYNAGELVEKIKNIQQVFEESIVDKLLEDIQRISKMLYLLYFLITTNYKMAFISLTVIIFNKIGEFLSLFQSGIFNIQNLLKLNESYNNHLSEFIMNIKVIKSFATEKLEIDKIKKIKREIYSLFLNIFMTLYELVAAITRIGDYYILYYTGSVVISGKISFGDYTIFQSYLNKFQIDFTVFFVSFKKYSKYLADWRSFFELYDYKPRIKSVENYIPKGEIQGKLEFKNVKFNYPLNPESIIFEDLSFVLEPGKVLAFVGSSGSGKTTITNLIERFYDPVEGRILLDDKDIKDYNLDWYHKCIGYVSQEPVLCNGTVEYNITYGLKEYSKKKFDEVCEMALVNQFLQDKKLFPNGLDTLVGERGSQISGGQKQRIAIARALMRDVKILILDEATSALDAEFEDSVQKALDNLVKEKKLTTIIIAHRLSTIKNADKIIILNKGKIVESGTHEELINLNGEYKRLMSKQLN